MAFFEYCFLLGLSFVHFLVLLLLTHDVSFVCMLCFGHLLTVLQM
jgi:hypothetical protein